MCSICVHNLFQLPSSGQWNTLLPALTRWCQMKANYIWGTKSTYFWCFDLRGDSEVLSSSLFQFILLASIPCGNIWNTCILVLWFRDKSPEHDWKYVKYCNCMNKQTHTVPSQGPLGSPLLLGWQDTLLQPPTTKPHMETGMQFLHLSHTDSAIWCCFSLVCALSYNLCSSEPNWVQLHRPSKPNPASHWEGQTCDQRLEPSRGS